MGSAGFISSHIQGSTTQGENLDTSFIERYVSLGMSDLEPGDIFWYNNSHYKMTGKTISSLVCERDKSPGLYYFSLNQALKLTVLKAKISGEVSAV